MSAESKEGLLRQCDRLRDEARRARRLATGLTNDDDRERLLRHAQELEAKADRLEKAAAEARTGVFAPAKEPPPK